MKPLALAAALLACAGPAAAMNYTVADLPSRNVIDLRVVDNVPAFPGDLVTCEEGDAPGVDCNCIDGDEDACTLIPWTACDTDTDCEIKSRSPYGWAPTR
jgi:hypothetical protein